MNSSVTHSFTFIICSSKTKAVPDNRRQAESLSLSREVYWSRSPQAVGPPQHRPLLHSASGPHTGLDTGATAASVKLTKLQELQDKKQTMDKILQELHSLRDQTLNNNSSKSRGFLTYVTKMVVPDPIWWPIHFNAVMCSEVHFWSGS